MLLISYVSLYNYSIYWL